MKKMMIAAFVMMAATPALAVDVPESMTSFAQEQMQQVAQDPAIIAAIRAQNAQTQTLSEAQILEIDQTWGAETEASTRPMIDATLSNPVSVILVDLAQSSGGRLTEVFVMDARGLNVGQSGVSSDYWQGDEAKFTKTYPNVQGNACL